MNYLADSIKAAAAIIAAAMLITSLYEAHVLYELNEPTSCMSTSPTQGHTTSLLHV